VLALSLRAHAACPADLALRFGPDPRPGRVELLCNGAFSPALLRAGDLVRSSFRLSERGLREVRERGLWLGALQRSGAPIAEADPAAIRIPVQSEGVSNPALKDGAL
jgi:hypothetical protein